MKKLFVYTCIILSHISLLGGKVLSFSSDGASSHNDMHPMKLSHIIKEGTLQEFKKQKSQLAICSREALCELSKKCSDRMDILVITTMFNIKSDYWNSIKEVMEKFEEISKKNLYIQSKLPKGVSGRPGYTSAGEVYSATVYPILKREFGEKKRDRYRFALDYIKEVGIGSYKYKALQEMMPKLEVLQEKGIDCVQDYINEEQSKLEAIQKIISDEINKWTPVVETHFVKKK